MSELGPKRKSVERRSSQTRENTHFVETEMELLNGVGRPRIEVDELLQRACKNADAAGKTYIQVIYANGTRVYSFKPAGYDDEGFRRYKYEVPSNALDDFRKGNVNVD